MILTAELFAQACQQLLQQEPVFAAIHHTYGPPPHWKRKPGFDTLVQIILEQQVSLDSARAHYLKLRDYTGELVPEKLLTLTDDEFLTCQVTRQKRQYLRHLSQLTLEGTLNIDQLEGIADEAVIGQLCQVKGIGPWTASVYLMFALQRADCFPPGDIALIQSMRSLWPALQVATTHEITAYAGGWKPYRSLASFYLWWWYLNSRNRKMPVY